MLTVNDRKGLMLITTVIFIFLFLAIVAAVVNDRANKYDPQTLCPLDQSYEFTHIVIDKTDPWSTPQKNRIHKIVLATIDSLQVHERLSIHLIDKDGLASQKPIFDLCNPGRGDQASPIYENPRMVQKKFNDTFGKPLETMLNGLLEPGTAPKSPLIATLNIIGNTKPSSKLIFVSDLMENNEGISFYDNVPDYDSWHSSYGNTIKDTEYSTAHMYYIDRIINNSDVKTQVKRFWNSHLNQISTFVTWDTL